VPGDRHDSGLGCVSDHVWGARNQMEAEPRMTADNKRHAEGCDGARGCADK
jgi:hypothetical protein